MKPQMTFAIGLVKPVKRRVFRRFIKATDKSWREAIFGLGGSRKRIARASIGTIDGQPIRVICELQTEIVEGVPWMIRSDTDTFAFVGPAAVYNDAGYGPASLGIALDQLEARVTFDPEPDVLKKALQATAESKFKNGI